LRHIPVKLPTSVSREKIKSRNRLLIRNMEAEAVDWCILCAEQQQKIISKGWFI
jgi:hypothetical protein